MTLHTSITTSRTVDFNFASVRGEALGGILGCYAALEGKATGADMILRESQLFQRSTSRDLNLSGHNIDASNLLGDGVLYLNTGVNLNEVIPVLLVDQELGRACVAVFNRLGKPDRISQDGITGCNREILRRSNLDYLLMTALNTAVTLVEMDNIAEIVTKKLDLDVFGLVEEALDEDGAVAKG